MKQGFGKTQYSFLEKQLVIRYGRFQGIFHYQLAEQKLQELLCQADFKNNKAIKWDLVKNMLPVIAIYLSLKEHESTSGEAYEFTSDVLQFACKKAQRKNRILARLPYGYKIFKLFCKTIITRQYPDEGWKTDWIRYDNKEIHFNFSRCLYVDVTRQFNCFELCELFCTNDDITLAGYSPAILFKRNGTLGRGQTECDFHFLNGKHNNVLGNN